MITLPSTVGSPAHPAFTPTALPPEQLDAATVGRDELIERLVSRIRDAATTKARRHTLLVGARGSGKTHTLAVAVHRALRDENVSDAIVLAWIPEDSLTIASYADLLVELARQLDPGLAERARALRRERDRIGLEQIIEEYAAGRPIVLLVENLDRVFRDLGSRDAGAFRAFVETSGRVLVLASTPLLFSAVSSRSEPWYGSFDTEHLAELTVAEGAQIVRRRALGRDESELATFVMSPQGMARLEALAHLAGGSPRLWQILADAVTIDSLDRLVPAVEKLLDDLAPYYQQRLWELGPNDQKLVVELARGTGAASVAELADRAGLDQRVAASALGQLADASWVRKSKAEGGDRRKSWYELREPLLRHHLQYRDSRGEPLRVIVEVLRGWYAPDARRRALGEVEFGSTAERFLSLSMAGDPPARGDSSYGARDVTTLLAEARAWRRGTSTASVVGSDTLGEFVEEVVATARAGCETQADIAAAVGAELAAVASDRMSPGDRQLLTLIECCWNGADDPLRTVERLSVLRGETPADSALQLLARDETAYWTGKAGESASARDQYAALLPDRTRILGPDHTDTLATRHNLAHWTGQAGDPASARDQCAALLADRTRILGPDHPSTIRTQWEVGRWTLLSDHRLAELGLPEAVLAKLATEYSLLPLSPGQALSLAHDMTAIGESAALVALAQALIRPGGAGVWLAAYQDVGGVSDEVTETLAAAVDGDPEARMRLPEELRRLVDERHVQG